MTQQAEIVETPLAMRSVQITLMVIAISVAGGVVYTTWTQSDPGHVIPGGVIFQVDLNSAPPHELALLPGVGPVLANRISLDRSLHGDFTSVDDLDRVHGIGPKTLQQIRKYCVTGARLTEEDGFEPPKGSE